MVDEKETLTDMRRKDNEREEKIKEELSCQFVLIKKIMMSIFNLVKYAITLLNQIKNQLKNQLKSLC